MLSTPSFQEGTETLAAIAARFGFADQAHLALEFRRLAGMFALEAHLTYRREVLVGDEVAVHVRLHERTEY